MRRDIFFERLKVTCICKLIKTFTQNSISNERLSDLAMMFMKEKIARNINGNNVIDWFSKMHKNKKITLY